MVVTTNGFPTVTDNRTAFAMKTYRHRDELLPIVESVAISATPRALPSGVFGKWYPAVACFVVASDPFDLGEECVACV